jgi:hypothetical protein
VGEKSLLVTTTKRDDDGDNYPFQNVKTHFPYGGDMKDVAASDSLGVQCQDFFFQHFALAVNSLVTRTYCTGGTSCEHLIKL